MARSAPLNPLARRWLNLLLVAASGQVTLGILTLLYHVPVDIASAHQAGALTLLTAVLGFVHRLGNKKPPRFVGNLKSLTANLSPSEAARQAVIKKM